MSGQKGIKHYGVTIIDQVLTLRQEGKTHREIADLFGLRNPAASKELLKRYHQKVARLSQGILPCKN